MPNQQAWALGRKGRDLLGKYLLAKTSIPLSSCMDFSVGKRDDFVLLVAPVFFKKSKCTYIYTVCIRDIGQLNKDFSLLVLINQLIKLS